MGTLRPAILLAVLLLAGTVAAQADKKQSAPSGDLQERGTICVLPNSPEPPTKISPGGEYNPTTLTVSIDKGSPIHWPHKKLVKIENLLLNERHLVVLTSDGKRIQSFHFQFSDYREVKLCLYFDGYQGVQMGDKQSTYWCKCK